MHATAYAFRIMSARVFCLPDAECQSIFLADDQCQGICLLDTVRQGISIDVCHCIYFWTALPGAHTVPNPRRPCACVLDKVDAAAAFWATIVKATRFLCVECQACCNGAGSGRLLIADRTRTAAS